jgi:xanthine dehydrogenase accessory factor
MSTELTVLVCGIDEEASEVARGLFGEGYAVALHRANAPRSLRRRMNFADAWYDGYAALDGIESRRADVGSEFMLGMQSHAFIPLLRGQLTEVLERWPWHVVVAAREEEDGEPDSIRHLAPFTIGLGASFLPGVHCDVAIATRGPDPGAILREGDSWPDKRFSATEDLDHVLVSAPVAGLFRAEIAIGASVERGAPIGFIGDTPVAAPIAGRILGIARKEQAVAAAAPVVEIAPSPTARVAGVGRRSQLIARGVAFAIEMENEGVRPLSFQDWR